MPTPSASDELIARASALQSSVKHHKASIGRHRSQLQVAAAELKAIEAQCRRLGITLVVVPPPTTQA